MSDRPRIRVAALMMVEDRIVLVRHAKEGRTYYLLPGGGVEYGESLGQALKREVAEETGLECAVGRPLFISDTIDPSGARHVVNITFACDPDPRATHTPVPDERVVGVELVRADDLDDLDIRPPLTSEIRAAIADPAGYSARYLGSLFVPEHPEASQHDS